MSQISLKSISGITSITTPAGVDNQFTLHTNNTSQALKLDSAGNIHVHNHINTTGVSTASNFKTGSSNLHSTGLSAASIDVDDFVDVGSNIKLGNAGVITATSFVGSGAALTGITQTTINNNADNRIITGSGTANTLEGESGLTYSSNTLDVNNAVKLPDDGTIHFGVSDTAYVRGKDSTDGYVKIGTVGAEVAIFTPEKTIRTNQCPALETTAGAINITGGTSGGRIALQGTTTSAGAGLAEIFAFWGTNKVAGIIASSGSDTTNKDDGQLLFYTSASGPAVTERLRITSAGSLGIGTATPQVQTHIFGADAELLIERGGYSEAELWLGFPSGQPFIASGPGKGLKLGGNGKWNEGMLISSEGYVTKPETPSWMLRPSYSSNQTLGSGTHAVGWSSSDYNTHAKAVRLKNVTLSGSGFSNNLHDGQTYGKIVVPVAGIYRVWCTIRMENTPVAGNLFLYVDGSQVVRQHVEMWNHRPYMHGRIEQIVNLNANSYIIWALNCNGGVVSGIQDTVNWCGGHLIG